MIKLDVVCPLHLANDEIDRVIGRLKVQKDIELNKVVFPITEEGDVTPVIARIQDAGFSFFLVPKEEFSHSLTRQRAIFEYCESDVVVMLSQDVCFVSDTSVAELASAVNAECVYAFGKQICTRKSIERYTREKNYGDESLTVGAEHVEDMQLSAFFASDAFSAYHRPTFLALGGYDDIHMMMNEDMYYAKKIIDRGYKKAYVATAVVEHSHRYTLRQLYRRYYATGRWFAQHPEFDGYKTTDSGMKLAKHVLKRALRDFNIPVLFRFLPDMTSRYLGMKKGKRMRGKRSDAAGLEPRDENEGARKSSCSLTYRFFKRAFDIVASGLFILLFSWLYLILAIVVKCSDGGPVFYKHPRVGKNGKAIYIRKFRSMVKNADKIQQQLTLKQLEQYQQEYKVDNDPRITRVGRFLRKTSLDELPNVFAVFSGAISLVGPRPIMREEAEEKYGKDAEKLLSVKPGMIGWWAANGRSNCTYESGERQKMELYYVDHCSPLLDLKIIFKTIVKVFKKEGAQ